MKKNQATLKKALPMWHLIDKWVEDDVLLSKECIIFLHFLNQLPCLFGEFSYLEKNMHKEICEQIVSHQATHCVVLFLESFTRENFTSLVKWYKDCLEIYNIIIVLWCFWFIFLLFCSFPRLDGVPSPREHHSVYSKNNIGKGNNVHKFMLE